jgi:hypothetical protein
MAENSERISDVQSTLLRARKDYLDLKQTCQTGSIYRDPSQAPFGHRIFDPHIRGGKAWTGRHMRKQ